MIKRWFLLISFASVISILFSCNGSSPVGTVSTSPTPTLSITSPASPYVGTPENTVTPRVSNPKPGWTIFKGINYVTAITEADNGDVWFGTWDGYQGTGLYRFNSSNWKHFDLPDEDRSIDAVASLIIQDNRGNMWFGTNSSGVIKYDGNKFTAFTKKNGSLAGDDIFTLYKDKEGNIWASVWGISDKVFYYDGNNWQSFNIKYAKQEWVGDKIVRTFYQDKDGKMWFGTSAGLSVFDGTNWRTYSAETDGLVVNDIISICQDSNGNLWFGGIAVGVSRYDGKNWTTFKKYLPYDRVTNGVLPYDRVTNIVEDRKGKIWFSTRDSFENLDSAIVTYDGTNWSIFTGKGELPDGDTVRRIIYKDDLGNLWFSLSSGGVAEYNPG